MMNNLFMVLLLISIVLLLIGLKKPNLTVAWMKERTKKKSSLVYGALAILFFVLVGVTAPKTDATTSTTTKTTTSQASKTVNANATNSTAVKKSSTSNKEQIEKQKAATKAEAEKTLKSFDTVLNQYDSVYKDFNTVVQGLSKGNVDPVTAYNDLGTIKNNALTVYGNAIDLSVPKRYSDDQETLEIGIAELRSSIADLQKYLDDNKVSTMANATTELKQAQKAIQTDDLAIAEQALKDGYTPPSTKSNTSKK